MIHDEKFYKSIYIKVIDVCELIDFLVQLSDPVKPAKNNDDNTRGDDDNNSNDNDDDNNNNNNNNNNNRAYEVFTL